MRLVVVKLVTFFFFLVSVEALIDSICTPSVSYQYNLHHCIAHQCTVILVRASSECVQHFAFVFVQTVRGSGSSCLKEVGIGSDYLKEVGSGSDYLKEVSIGSDYLKEIGSGSSLLKENNTC